MSSENSDSNKNSHLPALFKILLVLVLLCVAGCGSYFYALHKIIDNEKLSVVKVDVSAYPKIKIQLKSKGFNYGLESSSFSVKEMSSYPKKINLINDKDSLYILEYTSLQPSPKDSKVNVFIYYKDHNKFIGLQTDYTIKSAKNTNKKAK